MAKKSKTKKKPSKSAKPDNPAKSGKEQVKFLKSVVENLINKQAVPIIDLLAGKKHVNEFLIAKKLELTINQTRNILYKLSDYGLVSFIRKKDKRKGWYIYFWTLNVYQSLSLLEENLKKEIENLEAQLKNRKEKRYYSCETCGLEVTEESALLNDFTCPECEEIYKLSESGEMVQELERRIIRMRREIELVTSERAKEEEKLEKKKTKKIKAAEAERSRKRKEKAAKTRAERKKAEKLKNIKKKPKKPKKKAKKKPKKLKKKIRKKPKKLKKKFKKPVKKKVIKKPKRPKRLLKKDAGKKNRKSKKKK